MVSLIKFLNQGETASKAFCNLDELQVFLLMICFSELKWKKSDKIPEKINYLRDIYWIK